MHKNYIKEIYYYRLLLLLLRDLIRLPPPSKRFSGRSKIEGKSFWIENPEKIISAGGEGWGWRETEETDVGLMAGDWREEESVARGGGVEKKNVSFFFLIADRKKGIIGISCSLLSWKHKQSVSIAKYDLLWYCKEEKWHMV